MKVIFKTAYLGVTLYWLLGRGVGNKVFLRGFNSPALANPCRALSNVVMLPDKP